MSSRNLLSSAQARIQNTLVNHGVALDGNNISVTNGNITFNQTVKERDPEKDCRRALRLSCTDPRDDRDKLSTLRGNNGPKRHVIAATCEGFLLHSRYKTWVNLRSRSQLLWIAGGEARGKTTLAIFLTEELDRMAIQVPSVTIIYYFIDRQDKRDTAVHVLRGLITRLIDERKDLFQYLYEEYEIVKDSLFGSNSIEALWRIFERMLRDPSAGQVYCILDGLDACTSDSLQRLIGRITKFFLNEPQVIIDEDIGTSNVESSQLGQSTRRVGFGLKMMLVSREEPEWLVDHLSEFPRVTWGSSRRDGKGPATKSKSTGKKPRLAEVATSIMRKQTMENANNRVQSAPSIIDHMQASTTNVAATNHTHNPTLPSIGVDMSNASQSTAVAQHIASPSNTDFQPANQTATVAAHGNTALQSPLTSDIIETRPPSGITTSPSPVFNTPVPATFVPGTAQAGIPSGIDIASPRPQTQEPQVSTAITAHNNAIASTYSPPPRMGSIDLINQLAAMTMSATSEAKLPDEPSATGPTIISETSSVPSATETAAPEKPPQFPIEDVFAVFGAEKGKNSEFATEPIQETMEEEIEEEDEDSYKPSLRLYIESKLGDVAEDRKYTTEVQSFICTAIEHRGDGTFLWIDLAIDAIKNTQVDQLESAISSLPVDLDSMYINVLLNIPQHLINTVIGVLRWTVCAVRPLDLVELTTALGLNQTHPADPLAPIFEIAQVCGILFTMDETELTVHIVHTSLVDLVTAESSPLLADPRLAPFHIRTGLVHRDITQFCISYLEQGCMSQSAVCQYENEIIYNQRLQQFPFLAYAASFWCEHLRESQDMFLNLASPFFVTKSTVRKNWFHTYWAFSTGKGTWMAPRNFTLLHLAAYLNLVPLAQALAQKGELYPRLEASDSHGSTPICYTVQFGHKAMFHFLVQAGAKQQALNETLLELACRKGQRDMVEVLLNMGYNVNAPEQSTGMMSGLYTMARWIPGVVNEGFDLSSDAWSLLFRDIGQKEMPLHKASAFNHLAVMELLVERGAYIDPGTTKGFTPLMAASYTGNIDGVHFLINRGANYRAMTTDLWLPLHYATLRGKLDIVKLYVELGVPVNSLTKKNKGALHHASYAGHADVVQYLIEKGSTLNLPSHKGETALHLATRNRRAQIVELLLSRGANRNAMNKEGKSPLQVALVMAQTDQQVLECVRILQTFGQPGYVPWTPPPEPETGTNPATQPTPVKPTSAPSDSGTKGAPQVDPLKRSFEPQVPPQVPIFESYEANINISMQSQQQAHAASAPYTNTPPTQPMYTGNQHQMAQSQPAYARHNSAPVGSQFTYDPQANMGTFATSASQPQGPPPPYAPPASGSFPMQPEKSPAFTTQNSANTHWNHTTPAPPTPLPLYTSPNSTDSTPRAFGATPQSDSIAPSPAIQGAYPSHHQSQYVQIPQVSHPQPSLPQHIQLPPQTYVAPQPPMTAPAQIPWQPPPSPFHTPVTPAPPQNMFQQNPSQMMTQAPMSPQQPQQPVLNVNTNQFPYAPQPAGQFLSSQPMYAQPAYSPQFSGSTTATTYNNAFEYSAPAVNAPYNPNIGQQPGIYFSGPPVTPISQKKKSFIGRLIN